MKQSILIDATHLGTKESTGVEVYTDKLLPLISTELVGKGWYVGWIGHGNAPSGVPAGVEWVKSPHRRFWSQTRLLTLLKKVRPTVFFTPSGLAPVGYSGKTVITVHDMAAYLDPGSFSTGQKFRLKFLIARNAKTAAKILTPSQYSKTEIKKLWNIDDEKVTVTPLGFEALQAEPAAMDIPLDLPLITYVSRIEKKKNIKTLLNAFASMSTEARLVLAGKEGVGSDEVLAAAKALPAEVRHRIFFPGYISDAQKAWLYANSAAVACPCPTEGFGLPVLEAFAAGLPVVAAAGGALPEIGDGAAVYARPYEPQDWIRQLEAVLSDKELVSELVAKGKKRAKEFTWEQTAKLTVEGIVSTV